MLIGDSACSEVVSELLADKVEGAWQYDWQKQLRFYSRNEDDDTQVVDLSVCGCSFPYGNEYLGSVHAPSLVRTPDTDRAMRSFVLAWNSMDATAIGGRTALRPRVEGRGEVNDAVDVNARPLLVPKKALINI